jgi:excisionase family DNA binding protein
MDTSLAPPSLTSPAASGSPIATAAPLAALWTIPEVARFLNCSPRHVNNLIRGGLPCTYIGRLVRFCPDRVREFVNEKTRIRARARA